jgi:DNA (cytosine-5)-methyltransferase 1
MKRDLQTMPLDLGSELIIDNFAGGGGTSTGLERAFGRPVDIAINHDPEALAMHAINHPHTKHLCESVWDVDPIKVTNNQPVGLVWLSPDCKHFSKAKGGKPVEKKIRGLAWVTLRWAAKCKPRIIMLENVEEFKTWGPLKMTLVDGVETWHPDPAKKGKTFESFLRQLRGHGYTVDHRELRASDHATPTIRKRFFLVARRDGLPILWPAATHGAPTSAGVLAGTLLPHRTAAECIDWAIPCPSIFERKRPLADATLRRIAKGIMRYVVDAAQPFIVGQGGPVYSGKPVTADQPLGTIATESHRSIVIPSIVPLTHQGSVRSESINSPFSTITGAKRGEKALASATLVQVGYGEREGQAPRALDLEKPLGTVVAGSSKAALVTALLTEHANACTQRVFSLEEPLRTQCGEVKGGHFSMVSAALVGVGGRAGDSRPRGADEPTATITAKGDTAVVTAVLVDAAHGEVSPTGVKRWGQGVKEVNEPSGTVTASGNKALATAFLAKHYTGVVGSDLDDPIGTITSSDHHSLVTAHIQREMGQSVGYAADAPLGTVTAGGGGKSALVTSNMIKLRGTCTGAGTDEPLGTISAQGQHHAEVRAFLLSYYGSDQDPRIGGPLATITSRDRFGLVTIQGQDYEIVDIGLRMLAPHELYLAQGFPAHYIINEIPDPDLLFVDGKQTTTSPLSLPRIPLTKSAQVRMCGNSVCPPLSEALIRANFAHEREFMGVAA